MEFFRRHLITDGYNTNFYKIEFRGATTSGELRSLCSLDGSYTAVNASISKDCLPAKLSSIGWSTIGLHGFSNRFFDRQTWWPVIGLNEILFIENQEVAILNRCGNAFRGACDKNLLELAISRINHPKTFAYVLTLNTHLPVVPVNMPSALSKICRIESLPDGACMHIAALARVFKDIVSSASTLQYRPLIVIVGDHAPPFSAKGERDAFLQNVVPGFVLVPDGF